MADAIQREKQIKKWNRAWKIDLIESTNPHWRDLWTTIVGKDVDSRFRGNDGREGENDGGERGNDESGDAR